MAKEVNYALQRDTKGMFWDLALYIPTVVALALIALKLWYGPNQVWAYLLFFLASFFFIAGANRVLASRLMILPSSPMALNVGKQRIGLALRNGERVDLVKEVRFFSDYAGKSFGLTGMDLSGKRRQFVFHRGQFPDEAAFKDAMALLRVYK